jgi:small ligand-binding sensory domain FIST
MGQPGVVRWASSISTREGFPDALTEATADIEDSLAGTAPDLVLAFCSAQHEAHYEELPGLLSRTFGRALVFGCSAESVIGDGHEAESTAGLSLTAAALPDVDLSPLHLDDDALPGFQADASRWHRMLDLKPEQQPCFLVLPDPFSSEVETLLQSLDVAFPQAAKLGGLASGGRAPGEHALFVGPETHRSGTVLLAMNGDLQVDPVVAHGCRPVGQVMTITRCQENLIEELDGKPVLEGLGSTFDALAPAQRAQARRALFVGLELGGHPGAHHRGDFLIRNILGLAPNGAGLAVADQVHVDQRVQFHLRDATSSAEDLEGCLLRYQHGLQGATPQGALLFSCLGRGVQMYGHPNHDSDALRRTLGELPLGGFFGNGEIGPVHGRTCLHAYTSAFGLFRSRNWN